MGQNERLLEEIDKETGEIIASHVLTGKQGYVIREKPTVYASGYYFPHGGWIKSFSLKDNARFFLEHPELFFYARVLAENLWNETGLLRNGVEPYRWSHLCAELGIYRTTVYRIREKLINYGIAGEVKVFGTKYICINPFIFGYGDRCLKEVAEYFIKGGRKKLNERQKPRKRAKRAVKSR